MVKFVMCVTKHPDMSREEFRDYWLNNHGPFFMKHSQTHKAKKYVQSHTMNTPMNEGLRESRGMLQEFDGVAEVWFDSVEVFVEAMNTPEGQELGKLLHEDECKFIDHSKSSAFFVEEQLL